MLYDIIHILLVEDNEGDILLTKEALNEGKIANEVSVVRDGKQAIDFLCQKEEYKNAKMPDLILLDVNLPKKNGHEVLHFIKNDDKLKHIPVIMLTTSSSEKDINSSYKNHANCYISKPVEVDDFIDAVKEIENFWFTLVKLPTNSK
jgi:CheY-like chemotaxis protein